MVVNKSGQHSFSYTGQGSVFRPCGICTDILGHIVVCDDVSNTVHLLDQDGRFLSLILSQQPDLKYPRGVCVDDENNLYVGQRFCNKVTVCKDLQWHQYIVGVQISTVITKTVFTVIIVSMKKTRLNNL